MSGVSRLHVEMWQMWNIRQLTPLLAVVHGIAFKSALWLWSF